jgi:hypothetical protein
VQGRRFLAIRNWSEHQRINRPTPSRLPPPDDPTETTLACADVRLGTAHSVLSESSMSPHPRKGKERKGRERRGKDSALGGCAATPRRSTTRISLASCGVAQSMHETPTGDRHQPCRSPRRRHALRGARPGRPAHRHNCLAVPGPAPVDSAERGQRSHELRATPPCHARRRWRLADPALDHGPASRWCLGLGYRVRNHGGSGPVTREEVAHLLGRAQSQPEAVSETARPSLGRLRAPLHHAHLGNHIPEIARDSATQLARELRAIDEEPEPGTRSAR